MIVKRNLSPAKVIGYVWRPLGFATAMAFVALAVHGAAGRAVVVPFAPVGTLGAALAVFVAFRNNASYGRWWEARTVWGTLHSSCRVLTRQLVAATDNAVAAGSGGDPDDVLAYRRETALRTVAFAHALRVQLRAAPGTRPDLAPLRGLLPDAEHVQVAAAANPALVVLQRLAVRIKDGVRAGMVGQFDPISLEPTLVSLHGAMSACERLKDTPTPRQYDYFTRLAVAVFSVVLPFGLLGIVAPEQQWLVVALTILVAGVFVVLERVGSVIDTPFAGRTTDVPLTYLTTEIERDVRELLGDAELPPRVVAVDGYLW